MSEERPKFYDEVMAEIAGLKSKVQAGESKLEYLTKEIELLGFGYKLRVREIAEGLVPEVDAEVYALCEAKQRMAELQEQVEYVKNNP